MNDFVRVLGCFDEATTVLSGEHYETASLIIPVCYALKQAVEVDPQDSEYAAILRSALKSSVDFYLARYDYLNAPVLSAITFLDPRYEYFVFTGFNDILHVFG